MGVSVREKKKGSGVWWVFISHLGRRKAKKIGTDKDLADEVAEKIKAKLVLNDLKIEKPEHACPTFKQHAELWLSLDHDWKPATRTNYRSNLEKHVFPKFGKIPLDRLRRKDFKMFFDQLLAGGMARSTVALVKAPMAGVFGHALDCELIEANPLSDLKVSKAKRKFTVEPLTEAEVPLLLAAAADYRNGQYYPHLLCALRTGMRLGEIKALQWADVDLINRRLHVRRSCRRKVVSDTKTGKARFVDITPQLAEALADLKVSQELDAIVADRPQPVWVFANKKGEIFGRVPFENALRRCLDAAGLRWIRIHDCRHTYATIRLLRGHTVGDVSYQLGHSSIQMTYDIYGHWIPSQFKSEVDELDRVQPAATHAQPAVTG